MLGGTPKGNLAFWSGISKRSEHIGTKVP